MRVLGVIGCAIGNDHSLFFDVFIHASHHHMVYVTSSREPLPNSLIHQLEQQMIQQRTTAKGLTRMFCIQQRIVAVCK